MGMIDPLDTTRQIKWLAAIFGGVRYMSVDLQDFPQNEFTLSFWFRTNEVGLSCDSAQITIMQP